MPEPDAAPAASAEPVAEPVAPPAEAPKAAAARSAAGRSAVGREADHRAVEQLATDLLPSLIARLSASGLAELEVREEAWKVRLRRPLELIGAGRRATDRQLRLPGAGGPGTASSPSHGASGRAGGRDAPRADGRADGRPDGRAEPRTDLRIDGRSEGRGGPTDGPGGPIATSPAVGIFRPEPGIAGTHVRAGDRLGVVDMLGVSQEIVAPSDGVVGEPLAAPGDGVEYGQALFAIDLPGLVAAGPAIVVDVEEHLPAPAGERS